MSYHIISYRIILHQIILYHITSYYIILYHIILHQIILYHMKGLGSIVGFFFVVKCLYVFRLSRWRRLALQIISYYITSYYIILCHFISYHVILYHFICHIISLQNVKVHFYVIFAQNKTSATLKPELFLL